MNIVGWLRLGWRHPGDRQAVISEYAELKGLPHILADIALRGRVFGPAELPGGVGDLTVPLAIAEGRRQMAVEILRLAGADHAALMRMCFQETKRDQS